MLVGAGSIAGLDPLLTVQISAFPARTAYDARAGLEPVTSQWMAQMKAASSRAIAVAITVDFLPFLDSRRNRAQSRT